jgi:fatty acid synthase subunit alpha
VQNEIIGDLTEELGSLPDQPEDIALSDLATKLSESGQGTKLGARTNAMINKLATSKMTAGSSVTVLRQYLDHRWGFKQGFQDRALLLAISRPPPARLAGEKEVHSFLDDIAHSVLKSIGVDPTSLSSGVDSRQDESARAAISSAALTTIQTEWRKKNEALLDVYAKQLGHDINGAMSEKARAKITIDQLQAKNDAWSAEHGEAYERGIIPAFDVKKARKYDSYWNWAVEQVISLFSTSVVGHIDKFTSQAKQSLDTIPPRATPHLLQVIGFLLQTLKDVPESKSNRRQVAQEWLLALEMACKCSLSNETPTFRYSVVSTVPILDIDDRGQVSVMEVPRMVRPSDLEFTISCCDGCDSDDARSVIDTESYYVGLSAVTPSVSMFSRRPAATVETSVSSTNSDIGIAQDLGTPPVASSSPRLSSMRWTPQLKTKGRGGWHTNYDITNGYLRWFQRSSIDGLSFGGKQILVTGAGKGSIGSEVVSVSLAAGAKVLVTTSSYSKETCDYYKDLYHKHGSRGSQLVIVPFNGGSAQDVRKLTQYIYDNETNGGLGWDLDHIIPFAAVGEAGRAIDSIDDKSELAHRVMLTNVVRLLGAIQIVKAQRRITTHPTHVLLPLSPNHGVFGQDGLYAESKIALEALLNKWWSEDWNEYLTLCGVVIGWTRGTGLMSNNDVLATGVEAHLGIRTFSAAEMVSGLSRPTAIIL